jgi:hypothetical protein
MIYQPPFTITSKILNLIAAISERLGCLSVLDEQAAALSLRCANRIHKIQGALAIEGNTKKYQNIMVRYPYE